jgi:hypothetical protein
MSSSVGTGGTPSSLSIFAAKLTKINPAEVTCVRIRNREFSEGLKLGTLLNFGALIKAPVEGE